MTLKHQEISKWWKTKGTVSNPRQHFPEWETVLVKDKTQRHIDFCFSRNSFPGAPLQEHPESQRAVGQYHDERKRQICQYVAGVL